MDKINTNQIQKNILVVDDDRELVHDLKDYADHHDLKEKNGLNFVFAKSCKEALKKIVEQKIDLIVLEVILPVVNGYYLLNALKKEGTKIPVMVYTRLKGPQDLAKLTSYDVDNIFLKQLMKMEDLVQIIISHESGDKAELDKVLLELQSQMKSLSDNETQSSLRVMECPKCHMILPQGSHFCNNCGQKIFKSSKKVPIKKVANNNQDIKQK